MKRNFLFVKTCSKIELALRVGDDVFFHEDGEYRKASQTLIPAIDSLFKRANASLDDIEVLATTIGPGSFTGIRIGISTVKAFAQSKGLPIVAVNSLVANAYNEKQQQTLSIIDGSGGTCYVALAQGTMVLMPPKCIRLSELPALVAHVAPQRVVTDNPDFLVGDDILTKRIPPLVDALIERGEYCDHFSLMPLYIRKAQPERGEGDL